MHSKTIMSQLLQTAYHPFEMETLVMRKSSTPFRLLSTPEEIFESSIRKSENESRHLGDVLLFSQ